MRQTCVRLQVFKERTKWSKKDPKDRRTTLFRTCFFCVWQGGFKFQTTFFGKFTNSGGQMLSNVVKPSTHTSGIRELPQQMLVEEVPSHVL